MIPMFLKNFTSVREKFIYNNGKIAKDLIRTNSERFEFIGETNGLKVIISNKSVKGNLLLMSCSSFRCRGSEFMTDVFMYGRVQFKHCVFNSKKQKQRWFLKLTMRKRD